MKDVMNYLIAMYFLSHSNAVIKNQDVFGYCRINDQIKAS